MNPVNNTAFSVSVVIPLYNKASYVRRAVQSVLQQSHRDFELIVVDDGSTDGSAEVLADIADARLTVHRQANAGAGAARNTGMALARNTWIALLDADDMWLPNHLAELAQLAQRFPTAGLITTRIAELRDGRPVEVDKADRQCAVIDYFNVAAHCPGLVHSSSAAVRSDVVSLLGGFSNDLTGEDKEYWVRIALHFPVAVSQRNTSVYYRGTNGIMEQLAARERDCPQYAMLADVTPALRTICEAPLEAARQQSIDTYINAELLVMIRGSLYRGEVETARTLSWLSPAPTAVLRILRIVLALPRPLVAAMAASYRTMRARYRALWARLRTMNS